MANNDHVTKADLKAGLNALRDELLERITEALHDMETKLLKAFYGFAETTQERIAQYDVTQRLLDARMGTVERRLLELEKRNNFPSAS